MDTISRMRTEQLDQLRTDLFSDLLFFIKYFYAIVHAKPFLTPFPPGRDSHYVIITEKLQQVFDLQTLRLIVNVPPGHGKSTILVYFIAWALAQYPDSKILYISYSADLAESHTAAIKQIISLPEYGRLFGVGVDRNFSSRGDFRTTIGGRVVAKGSSGTITGLDAGLPYLERFSGLVVIDDAHKPDEVHSDTMREAVNKNYNETIKSRARSELVPYVFIGQRLHEADLPAFLESGQDGHPWELVKLQAIDGAGNALCPAIKSLEWLQIEKQTNPYVFFSQYQQEPQPAGGGLFKEVDFQILYDEPDFIRTIITVDTAETDKSYNDPTVFTHSGIYKVLLRGAWTGQYALHIIQCVEIRVEPEFLETNLLDFYTSSLRHKTPPDVMAIEKKSTGVTLLSAIKKLQGVQIIDIQRTKASGSKTARFIELCPFVAQHLISLPANAPHTEFFIKHMGKITANNTHAHDDICDTVYDAVKIGLMCKMLTNPTENKQNEIVSAIQEKNTLVQQLRSQRKW